MIWGSLGEEYEEVTLCSLVGIRRRFGGNCCLHLPLFYPPLFLSTCTIVFFDNVLSLLPLYITKICFIFFPPGHTSSSQAFFLAAFASPLAGRSLPSVRSRDQAIFSLSVYFTLNFAAWLIWPYQISNWEVRLEVSWCGKPASSAARQTFALTKRRPAPPNKGEVGTLTAIISDTLTEVFRDFPQL